MTTTTKSGRGVMAAASTALLATAAGNTASADQDAFLEGISSGDSKKIAQAWKTAEKQDPSVILPLGKLLSHETFAVRKGASECLLKLAHSIGKDNKCPRRKAITNYFLQLLECDKTSQVFAFRTLSLIADGDSVPYIVPFLNDDDLFEEAIFCLERIPCPSVGKVLVEALGIFPDQHKPRIMAALAHIKEAKAVPLLAELFKSDDKELAVLAMKAISRIGVKPEERLSPPDYKSLSFRQQKMYMDSVLRFCDEMIKQGAIDIPKGILGEILKQEDDEFEEQIFCAAIVSASKLTDADAAKAICKQLGRTSYIIRDTAEKALVCMKGDAVDAVLKEALQNTDGDVKQKISEIIKKRQA